MASAAPALSRRERLRAEALAEIRALALEQIAAGGPAALSLNAIARSMGMSGPALYRYFPSRDALLSALVADLYGELASALEAGERAASGRSPEARLRALADAYRDWAIAHPHAYRLILGAGARADDEDPPEVVAAAQRSMERFIDVLGALAPAPGPPRTGGRDALGRSLRGWAAARGLPDGIPAVVLRLGLVAWSRLHGIVSLELEGTYRAMGVDAGALYRTEVDQLVRDASAG